MQVFESHQTQIFINLLFKPRNFWVGLYISNKRGIIGWNVRDYLLCIIPMLQIRLKVYKLRRPNAT